VDAVFKRYSESLIDTLSQSITMNNETSRKLASTMDSLALAGTEQYEKAAKAAAKLLEDVVVEMNKAMDGVGHEIAESISQASAGSAEIVDRLAQKTAQLKEEYDLYFSRVENQSAANLTEMEFRIQNVFSRFSDEASGIMDRLETSISSSMNLFEGNTASLLHNIEEESRSIGLYVKDLNIDVTSLSTTLRESVGIFTDQLKNSTEKTFEAFDDGLAEVSERLANTVESIRESVENLPQVIGTIK
jgi:ABC-type transporter Mla subunit MlaD